MRGALRNVGIYFGFIGADRDGEGEDAWHLQLARPMLVSTGCSSGALALISLVIVVVGFGWDLSDTLVGGLIGAALWGVVWYAVDIRDYVPRSALLSPPRQAVVDLAGEPSRYHSLRVLSALPVLLALAWFIDRSDLGAFLILGQFAGTAGAHLVAAALVLRWERTHPQRVLFRANHADTEIYGVSRTAVPR